MANDGGHLRQLRELSERLEPGGAPFLWATVPTPQTESLLEGEEVVWTAPAPTRDWRAAMRNARTLAPIVADRSIGRVVSTGSSLAVSALPRAALARTPAHYIESITRSENFSLSGRVVRRVPGVRVYTQWPQLARGAWRYRGSVLDGFAATASEPPPSLERIVVSLGTSSTYGFRRLVERLVHVIPRGADVLWQTGCTDVSGLDIEARPAVPAAELDQAIAAADVVVAHAGAGIALSILSAGRIPLLVPRDPRHAEHVDNHQQQIADALAGRHLAIVSDVDSLSLEQLERAGGQRATRTTPPPFVLDE